MTDSDRVDLTAPVIEMSRAAHNEYLEPVRRPAPLSLIHAIRAYCPAILGCKGAVIGGGFIRSYYAGEPVMDLDAFFLDKPHFDAACKRLEMKHWKKIVATDRAVTFKRGANTTNTRTVQLICFEYGTAEFHVNRFDFTVCSAVLSWQYVYSTKLLNQDGSSIKSEEEPTTLRCVIPMSEHLTHHVDVNENQTKRSVIPADAPPADWKRPKKGEKDTPSTIDVPLEYLDNGQVEAVLYMHPDFFEHLSGRLLVVANPSTPLASLWRAVKFLKRGYHICEENLIRLVERIQQTVDFSDPKSIRQAITTFDPDGGRRIRVID